MKYDLSVLWSRADLEEPVFTGDEYMRVLAPIRALIESQALIRRAENSTAIECDACGERHVETVELLTEPFGAKPRAYIFCPEMGRVSVALERLQQWSVDVEALCRTVASALELGPSITALVAGRVWLLGTRQFHERTRDVFLIRGITWPDSLQLLQATQRLTSSPCPLILCLKRFPDHPEWRTRDRIVLPLAETEWLGTGATALGDRLLAVVAEYDAPRPDEWLSPTPVADRPALMQQLRTKYNYRVKDIYAGANVDRGYLNKWKLGKVSDDSDPSQRIEKFIRLHRHVRRPGKSS